MFKKSLIFLYIFLPLSIFAKSFSFYTGIEFNYLLLQEYRYNISTSYYTHLYSSSGFGFDMALDKKIFKNFGVSVGKTINYFPLNSGKFFIDNIDIGIFFEYRVKKGINKFFSNINFSDLAKIFYNASNMYGGIGLDLGYLTNVLWNYKDLFWGFELGFKSFYDIKQISYDYDIGILMLNNYSIKILKRF